MTSASCICAPVIITLIFMPESVLGLPKHGFGNLSEATSFAATKALPPPKTALAYNGIEWPSLTVGDPSGETHVFVIGDWGGMDGSFVPPEGHHQIVAYPGGADPGPHVFPRSRPQCSHQELVDCYWPGKQCKAECGFLKGVDDKAQLLVAEQFQKRAALKDPKYILNVGDNFYWGGIELDCGSTPMNQIHSVTRHQFDQIFEGVYNGPGLSGKPWLSILGNHDWGGFHFGNAWDQQIAYTWASPRWIMPAVYWSIKVRYPAFTIDYFMLDSNMNDAKPPPEDPEHNICSEKYNRPGVNCAKADGPKSVKDCPAWFARKWAEQQPWVKSKLKESNADWQIILTHFPCDYQSSFYKQLHDKFGLDLLITGHRHDQELWKANQKGYAGILGGLTCIVSGGGGGIASEESPLPGKPTHGWVNVNTAYGFFDLTISKDKILIESIDYKGKVLDSTEVLPKA
eukprot:TRINITY_DN13148_c1_g7_i1.p1 TRINITY_DN13148_c1_g7~~TRINITY_DN13148_c1_g7_i1.p1  ORF type:complete len:457 (-),score=87.48 TRINITY_DN13148_c1_g7_i1:8-1378(-)